MSVDDLPKNCKIEDASLNLEYLENETGGIVFHAYLISISEVVGSCTSKGNGSLLSISGYNLAILWGRDCFFTFDPHNRDSSWKKVVNGTAVLLKYLPLHHMDKRTYFQGN